MSELKKLIRGLILGERSFEDVSRALEAYLAATPDGATDAARLLQAARKAGLRHHLFVALNGQLAGTVKTSAGTGPAAGSDPTNGGGGDADATRFASPDIDDGTDDGSDPDATMLAAGDPDATVLAGDGADVTAIPGSTGEVTHNPVSTRGASTPDGLDATLFASEGSTSPGPRGNADRTAVAGASEATTTTETRGVSAHGRFFDPLSGKVGAPEVGGEDTAMGAAPGGDATTLGGTHPGSAARRTGTGNETGFDIPGEDALGAADRAAARRTRAATGARSPASAAGAVAGVDREFHEGDLLRGRFELISKLGEGGMGAVWKGKDKLKEEARDRNPFVAIKLLQGDFKAHPEAFIALQRETAKQQRLAHPNIATVYDFDRDDATSTVFMTMEVLEGQPLDTFIRKLPADGLPEEEAMPLIEQLCAGLSYAHQASLVHSDLKPGNCFFTKEGGIKLLDFGIARASKTKSDAEGDTTLFDPASLGALTPTYASIEMFEGEAPDPRDDIYALAIMAYQLLTGKHPYGKKSAPNAKELELVPEPVAKLSKAQNRGLARALAFHREDRPDSVAAFLDSITRKKNRTGLWMTGVAAVLALVVAGVWGPVSGHLQQQEREQVIATVQGGGLGAIEQGLAEAAAMGEEQLGRVLDDPRTINAAAAVIAAGEGNVQPGLDLLARYPAEWQQKVKEVDAARNAIFAHYEARITRAFAPAEQRYDFPVAVRNLTELDALYPDSAQVFQLHGTLDDIKRETLADMGERYNQLLASGALLPDANAEDISDVLAVVRAIDPEHFLLNDKNLPFRFAEETQKAIEIDRDFARASALLAASATHAADDPKLKGLRYDLDRILTRIENEKRIATLEARIAAAEPQLQSLADYLGVRDDVVALANLNAGNPVLQRVEGRIESAFGEAFRQLTGAAEWVRSEQLLFDFAALLSIADLTRARVALSDAEKAAGFTPDLAARQARVEERVAAIAALLASPEFTLDWEGRLKQPYKELIALQPLGSPQLETVRIDTARLLLGAAREARTQENFNQAREFVAKGLEFYPGLKNFTDENAAIEAAEKAFLSKRAEEERVARVETKKSEFRENVEANDVQAARRILDEIGALGVPARDPFLAATAPDQLSRAYQRLASQAAGNDDYLSAAELARRGISLNPQLAGLASALSAYEAEIKKREREIRLAAMFNSLEPVPVARTREALAALQADFPERYDAMATKFANARTGQLRKYSRSKDVDVARLAQRAQEFASLFPAAGTTLREELADAIEPRLRRVDVTSPRRLAALARPLEGFRALAPSRHAALESGLARRALDAVRDLDNRDKAAAAALSRAARAVFPRNAQIAALEIVVPLEEITTGRAQMQRNQLAAAARSLAAARARDPAHPDLAAFEAELGTRREMADALYAQHVAKARDPLGYKQKNSIRDLFRDASAACADCGFKERQPAKPVAGLCHPGLAGFGARRAGQCWDKVGRAKGPVMVVVPAGNGGSEPFAIGKYEVSTRDFNAFCKATKQCKVVLGSRSRLPATDVAASIAEAYASWLSGAASKALGEKVVYRLPTAAEWEHAASANGAQPEKKFNCRVTSGGNIIAGHDLVDARSGQENGWGLANYVGNARELVRSGTGFAVRGGDFAVPLTRCDVSVSEPHDGAADATTGFRLVRELG